MNIREWGNPIFGLPGDLQGFVRIELVRHHSYGNSKVCDDVTFLVKSRTAKKWGMTY